MPKHGWRWRTERLQAMADETLRAYLSDPRSRISAKLGRWVYRNLEGRSESLAILGLKRVDWDGRAEWGHAFLWRELERRKSEAMGDWIIASMAWGRFPPDAARRFAALYDDPSVHPLTRGGAVYGLSQARESDEQGRLLPEYVSVARPVCQRSLQDESPYVRSFAVWLAARLGGFDSEIVRLSHDLSIVGGGYRWTVSTEATEALKESRHNAAQGFQSRLAGDRPADMVGT